jgi:hypothetical protein
MPRLLDLFCGRWGWSRAFAARGWECVGVDLVEPDEVPQGCEFVRCDVLRVGPVFLTTFDALIASSPCEKFSLFQMRNFHSDPPYPEAGIELFNHTRRIFWNSGKPWLIENVARAQDFIGKSVNHCGPFHLWGTMVPLLLPQGITKGMKMDREWCQELGGHGSAKRNRQTAGWATIPPELANCVADYAERLLEQRLPEKGREK